jgi:serine protease Do
MNNLRLATFATVLVLAGFVAGLVLTGRMRWAEESTATPVVQPQRAAAPATPPGTSTASFPDFSAVAAKTVNAVVNVSSLQVVRTPNSPFANDPFFRYFFGDDAEFFGSRSRPSYSLGSGVVISADGYVITNNHVVGENMREISAVLPDKREVRGKLVGVDPMTDIALLKLEASNLPVLPWGDSSKLKVGQWVLAIGSPFQLNQTVTVGIISAVRRANVGVAAYEDFIQTDAAINPGNSGGALVDTSGNLVGINTAIYSQSGGYQGIGFAIPSNLARRMVDDLIKYGRVRRGSIGRMEVSSLTTQDAAQLNLRETQGALVLNVSRAVYSAGIEPDDVIVSFNGQKVENASQFLRMVADAPVGSTATIGVIRGGRRVEVKVPIRQG